MTFSEMGVTLDELKKGTTRWRNPSLARYLFELGLAQERGTGIPRAVQETAALSGSEPTFEIGDWFKVTVRGCIELPSFKELHLFYRGPVAFGPLIGAIASGRKPLVVYYFDEDEGVYRSAYRIDRKLLQGE
jgi:hypothetical protein